MLNVKQGRCKYQLLKSFGLTQPGNQTNNQIEIKNRLTDREKTELTKRSRAILSNLIAGSGFKYYIS